MLLESLPVKKIVVQNRARKNVGNVLGLAESIQRLGLLHPIVVNSRHELIAGTRRLAAVKKLGWSDVLCHVVATLDEAIPALQAERDENTCREPLAPSEMVTLGKSIEDIEKPDAAKRREETQAKKGEQVGSGGGKLPPPKNKGKTRDKVGKALGVSGKTYEKAKQVTDAAEADPETFGDLPDQMDATSVDAAHKELKKRQEQKTEPEADEGKEFVGQVETLCRDIDQIARRMKALKSSRFAYSINVDSSVAQVEAARKTFWQGMPAHPCPYCSAEGCKACGNTGRVKKATLDSGKKAMGLE
jgi:ParB-like chromosome segregation protein Spo0J